MVDTVGLLRSLIRVDTTNPPGNEAEAIRLVEEVLSRAGVPTEILAAEPHRPNLVARLPGRGEAPPLLLHGHVDVVPVTGQTWSHDPFAADLVDGWVWGRGALDMKGGVVMMVAALARAAAGPTPPPGDVILCVVADEEAGGTAGARHLVERHAGIFDGVRHAIGEFGGFPFDLAGRRFYPVQIAERTSVRFEVTIRGPAGHGSLPLSGGAMARLGRALRRIDRRRMPVHVVPAVDLMLEHMMSHTDGVIRRALQALRNPRTADAALRMFGAQLAAFEPLLRNTVNATIVRGGDTHNVVPARIDLTLDGRLLPGLTPQLMAAEVQELLGIEAEVAYDVESAQSGATPDMSLYPLLADILAELDPDGIPVPFLLPASTDGRWFATLGIQHYGFIPMKLPATFDFRGAVHAADERIPVAAVDHGADALHRLVTRYRD